MSKKSGKLARRYARALLNAVEAEQGAKSSPTPAQSIASSLIELASIWGREPELRSAILNPMFDRTERYQALSTISQQVGLADVALRFLRVVFERDRIAALPEIAESFVLQADKAASVVQVEVTLAREIDSKESLQIEENLSKHIPGNLEFQWKIRPEIIGGMLVKYQGKVLDGSLSGRLERIERKLMA